MDRDAIAKLALGHEIARAVIEASDQISTRGAAEVVLRAFVEIARVELEQHGFRATHDNILAFARKLMGE